MNILFSDKSFNIFDNFDLEKISEYLICLDKFHVKSVSKYFESLKMQINTNIKSLNMKTHFNLLYLQTKLNQELVPLKSPIYVSFLMKMNEKIFNNQKEINPIKLAWTLVYHSYLDLTTNFVLEESLKYLISFMHNNSNWVNEQNIEEILEILIMIDNLKLYDVKVPKFIIDFFDQQIIANLINNRMRYNFENPQKLKVLEIINKQPNIKIEENKLTNVTYVDAVIELGGRKTPIMFISDFDYNSNGDLKTGYIIRKKHFENYFKSKVALIDSEKINSFNDISILLN